MGWLLTALLAAASLYDIERNLPRVPARIPAHFNMAGVADHWGSASVLWFLFATQVFLSGIILAGVLVARSAPSLVHFGRTRLSDLDPEQRRQVMPLFTDLVISLSVVIALGFHLLIHETMHAAAEPQHRLPVTWLLVIFAGGPVALLLYYLPRINRLADQR